MKKIIIIIAIILTLAILIINIEPISNYASDIFWNIIITQLDKEESERAKQIENGELVRGKDTILIWNNMYEIGHFHDGNHLEICADDISRVILERVQKHKVIKKTLYIVADEGYAVIDSNSLCKVFVTVSDEEYSNSYTKHNFEKVQNIQFLSSYDQFSEDEKRIFEKLLK